MKAINLTEIMTLHKYYVSQNLDIFVFLQMGYLCKK